MTSGKSHARTGIGGPSKQQRVVLRRRNTVVGGKCALPSALLVVWYVGHVGLDVSPAGPPTTSYTTLQPPMISESSLLMYSYTFLTVSDP